MYWAAVERQVQATTKTQFKLTGSRLVLLGGTADTPPTTMTTPNGSMSMATSTITARPRRCYEIQRRVGKAPVPHPCSRDLRWLSRGRHVRRLHHVHRRRGVLCRHRHCRVGHDHLAAEPLPAVEAGWLPAREGGGRARQQSGVVGSRSCESHRSANPQSGSWVAAAVALLVIITAAESLWLSTAPRAFFLQQYACGVRRVGRVSDWSPLRRRS